MKRKSWSLVLLTILMLLAFSLMGCGSNQEATSPQVQTPANHETAPEATPESNAAPATSDTGTPDSKVKAPDAAQPKASDTTETKAPEAAKPKASDTTKTKAPDTAKPTASGTTETKAPGTTETKAPETPTTKPDVPASLTGAKAEAYTLLVGCKYSGAVNGECVISHKDLAMIGDLKYTLISTVKGDAFTGATKEMPAAAGGDVNFTLKLIPFEEIITGDKADIEKFLKSAGSVSVADGVITISNATPPASLCKSYSSERLIFYPEDFIMSCKITVAGGKVKSITDLKITGSVKGASGKSYPGSSVTGSYTF